MTILQSLLFGALQGLTEFLPVSSSGHLAVLKNLLDLREVPLLFDIILHGATLLVVLIIFRKRIFLIFRALFRWVARKSEEEDRESLRLIIMILIATAVTGALGYFVNKIDAGRDPRLVSGLFIITGLILLAAKRSRGNIGYGDMKIRHALITGAAQGLGVFPGISRSGITIAGSVMSGVSREKAGEYSFILSIPAIIGGLILELRDAGEMTALVSPAALIAGFLTAFIVGFGALLLLIRFVRRGKLHYFSFYLLPLGAAGLIYFSLYPV